MELKNSYELVKCLGQSLKSIYYIRVLKKPDPAQLPESDKIGNIQGGMAVG